MYVQRYIVTRFRKNCGHGNATVVYFYCFWRKCSCQQYKGVHCYKENATFSSLCTFLELQFIP